MPRIRIGVMSLWRYPQGFRVLVSLQYLWDLADYREEIGLYAPGARLRLCFPSPVLPERADAGRRLRRGG